MGLNVQAYSEDAMRRLVALPNPAAVDWHAVVEKGLAAAYDQTDSLGLTSMVQLVAQLLDGQGRFEDAIGEIDHALAIAGEDADATVVLLGLKAIMLAAPGKHEEAQRCLALADTRLTEASANAAVRYRVFNFAVRFQALATTGVEGAEAVLNRCRELELRRERMHLLSWLIPFLAALGDRRNAHPWIRVFSIEAEASGSRWRVSDAVVFDAWDDFLSEPLSARSERAFQSANALSVWRGEALRLRHAVLRRDNEAADGSLRAMQRARRRLGHADVGAVMQYGRATESLLQYRPADSVDPPPAAIHLNNLGACMAEAEAVATVGSQRSAGAWLDAFTTLIPSHVWSALEWPTSVARVRGLLALRSGDIRRAKRELESSVDWARHVGFQLEEGLGLVQLGELGAASDLRVPERVWVAQRRHGDEVYRAVGYDPIPQAYAVAHALTLHERERLLERLSPREVQVLALLAEGNTYRQAAEGLGIAGPTVQTLAHRVYEKLGVSGRVQAVAEAKRLGVL